MEELSGLKPGEVATGTTIMAVEFDGGVVLGADSRTSTGSYVANRVSDKLTQLHHHIYCCRSGSAADTQALSDYVRYFLSSHSIELGRAPSVFTAASLMKELIYRNKDNLLAGVIVGGWDPKDGGQVYTVTLGGTLLRQKFSIGGSGSTYIYGHVDSAFKENMTRDECQAFVKKAISHAMARDGSSGGVIRMITIDSSGISREFIPVVAMALAEDATDLKLEALIGYNGAVLRGLQYTPCGKYIVYPLGTMVVVRNLETDHQSFLEGHNNVVSTLAISHDGKTLASGEVGLTPGTKADVCIWDLDKAKRNCDDNQSSPSVQGCLQDRLRQHLGKVQDVDFSCDGQFLATLGGRDDNNVIVWRLATSHAVCGGPAGNDQTLCVKWLNNRPDRFVTGGYGSLRVWAVEAEVPRMHAMEAKMGSLKRMIQCVAISSDDKYAYCGTKTGDLVRVRVDRDPIPKSFNDPDKVRPIFDALSKDRFGKGIKSVACFTNPATGNTNTLIGSGDGRLAVINPSMNMVAGKTAEVLGAVTSLSITHDNKGFLVGTSLANRYFVTFDFAVELRGTCHSGTINSVVFPRNCSDLFLTCSANDIRVWNASLRQELLRIQVPNLDCRAVDITPNGGTIVSGWSDGKVRAFYPESGRLKFVITNAHHESVTALAVCNDEESRPPWRIVSGGQDGRVRVWNVTSSHQVMVFSAKDHRASVTALQVTKDNRQCVSASADGSCIIWDLVKKVRLSAFMEPTVFKAALYHPDESQILTCGTNFKIAYWDAYDGSPIRVVEGGNAAMTCLDILPGGEHFVSGGADKLVKLWEYDDGLVRATGRGHSGTVTAVKFSPDMKRVVSVGEDGGIFIWTVEDLLWPSSKNNSHNDHATALEHD